MGQMMPQAAMCVYVSVRVLSLHTAEKIFVSLNAVALGDCDQVTICDPLVGHMKST